MNLNAINAFDFTPSNSTSPAEDTANNCLALRFKSMSAGATASRATPPPTHLFAFSNGLSPPVDERFTSSHKSLARGMLQTQSPFSTSSSSTANQMDPATAAAAAANPLLHNNNCQQYEQLVNMYRSFYATAAAASNGNTSGSSSTTTAAASNAYMAAMFNSYAALAAGAAPPPLGTQDAAGSAFGLPPQLTNSSQNSVSHTPPGLSSLNGGAANSSLLLGALGNNTANGGNNNSIQTMLPPPIASSTIATTKAAATVLSSPSTSQVMNGNGSAEESKDLKPFFTGMSPFGIDPFRPFGLPPSAASDFNRPNGVPSSSSGSLLLPPMSSSSSDPLNNMSLPAWRSNPDGSFGPPPLHSSISNNGPPHLLPPLPPGHFGFPPPHMPGGPPPGLPPHMFSPYGDPNSGMGPMGMSPYGNPYCGSSFPMDPSRRKNATRESTAQLKQWLYDNRKNPYPTKTQKIMLAILSKMTLTQVSTWFANARRRLKKENKMTWSPRNRSCEDGDDLDDDDLADDNDGKPNNNGGENRRDGTSSRRRGENGENEDVDVGGDNNDDDDCVDVDTVDNASLDPRAHQMLFMYPPPPPPPNSMGMSFNPHMLPPLLPPGMQHFPGMPPQMPLRGGNNGAPFNHVQSSAFAAVSRSNVQPPPPPPALHNYHQDSSPFLTGLKSSLNSLPIVAASSASNFAMPVSSSEPTSTNKPSATTTTKPKIWSLADQCATPSTTQVPPQSLSSTITTSSVNMLRPPLPISSHQQQQQQQNAMFMNNLLLNQASGQLPPGGAHFPLPPFLNNSNSGNSFPTLSQADIAVAIQQQQLAFALSALGQQQLPPPPPGLLTGFPPPPPPPPAAALMSTASSSAFSVLSRLEPTSNFSSSVSKTISAVDGKVAAAHNVISSGANKRPRSDSDDSPQAATEDKIQNRHKRLAGVKREDLPSNGNSPTAKANNNSNGQTQRKTSSASTTSSGTAPRVPSNVQKSNSPISP